MIPVLIYEAQEQEGSVKKTIRLPRNYKNYWTFLFFTFFKKK